MSDDQLDSDFGQEEKEVLAEEEEDTSFDLGNEEAEPMDTDEEYVEMSNYMLGGYEDAAY